MIVNNFANSRVSSIRPIRVFFICIIVAGFTDILFYIYQIYVRENYDIKASSGHLFPKNGVKLQPVKKSVEHDKYSIPEVDDFIQLFQSRYRGEVSVLGLTGDEPYDTFLKRLNSVKRKGALLYTHLEGNAKSSTERFLRGISQFHMYDPNNEQIIRDLLHDLSTLPIVHSAAASGAVGSQMKIKLTFSDGASGFVKTLRVPKDVDSSPDTFYFTEYERHNAEIAAFHIDRILGFHRAGPVVGRLLNITTDLASFISDRSAVEFVYTSPGLILVKCCQDTKSEKRPAVLITFSHKELYFLNIVKRGNMCIVVICVQKCGRYSPICGDGILLEVSVAASLPSDEERIFIHNPYKRTYTTSDQAAWEVDDKYCDKNLKENVSLFEVLELMDLAVLDFFTGNMDRHEYDVFTNLKEPSFVPASDNGRGFNNAKVDTISTLAPLQQCCLIRLSTLAKLIKLYQGPDRFSQVTRASLNSDPLSPILTETHLEALDRRVGKVIKVVSYCINNGRSWADVVIDDLNPQSNLFSQ